MGSPNLNRPQFKPTPNARGLTLIQQSFVKYLTLRFQIINLQVVTGLLVWRVWAH